MQLAVNTTLRKKCLYSEFFWFAFSRIQTEYGEILSISPCSVRMRENTNQKNSECGQFSRNAINHVKILKATSKIPMTKVYLLQTYLVELELFAEK